MRVFGILLFLLAILVACKTQDKGKGDKGPDLTKPKAYIEDGQNLKAKTEFYNLIKQYPQNPQILYRYALSSMLYNLQRTGDFIKAAFEVIKSITSSSPKFKTEQEKPGRALIDGILYHVSKILILDTADSFTRDMDEFFKVANKDFVFDIKKMTVNFYIGGESFQKFTIYGKHGIEEAYLLYSIAQIIRAVLYSILTLSFNVELGDAIYTLLQYPKQFGGPFALFAYPLTVGFPALVYLIEKNENVLTAPFKDEEEEAKKAIVQGSNALYKYSSIIYDRFSKGDRRKDFMIFLAEDDKAAIYASVGDEPPRRVDAGQEGIKGIEDTMHGAESVLKSLKGEGLVQCGDIVGPFTVLVSTLGQSGFLETLGKVAKESAPTEAKTVAEDFFRTVVYYIDWIFAIISACNQNTILFDFSKFWTALENLRGAFPVWFSTEECNTCISTKRNLWIEWECGTSTYDLDLGKLERNFNYLFCARKSIFSDSEHFSAPITLGKGITEILGMRVDEESRINPLASNPLPKDGIPSPNTYILLPDPSFRGFLRLDTRVLWPDCRVPCNAPCGVVEPQGLQGLCLVNAALAKLARYVYGFE